MLAEDGGELDDTVNASDIDHSSKLLRVEVDTCGLDKTTGAVKDEL